MEAFIVTGAMHQLGSRLPKDEDAYYRDFDPRPARFHRFLPIVTLIVGVFIGLGLPH